MGERSLLVRALLEHRDRRPNALLNEHHENLVRVAKKTRAAAAGRSEAADLHFDNGLTHTASPVIPFPPRSELLSTGDQKPKPFSFVPLPCQKFDTLEFRNIQVTSETCLNLGPKSAGSKSLTAPEHHAI